MNQVLKENSGAVAGVRSVQINSSGATTSNATTINSGAQVAPSSGADSKAIENAVYGHIRAIRALGRTQVTVSEIAAALSIPQTAVVQALGALRAKGVKLPE